MSSDPGAIGSHTWLIPDGYLPSGEADGLDSHEAICLLNTGQGDVEVEVTVYLEDDPPIGPFRFTVPGERTRHVRTDHLRTADGVGIPTETPYAVLLTASAPVTVQHSRMDLRSPNMALMTTAAIAVAEPGGH